MLTKNLESLLRVALEGPKEVSHEFFNEAIGIWKNNTKFKFPFSYEEWYLCEIFSFEQEDN